MSQCTWQNQQENTSKEDVKSKLSTVDSRYLEHALSRTKLSVPLAPIQAE